MNGIVCIPAFDRPAFLKVCIDHIIKADNAETMRYVFALDHGYNRACLDVIKQFPFEYAILERSTRIPGIGKQSNNVLMGLKSSYEYCDGNPIYYIEDDVFIGKDFFTFGAKVLSQSGAFCAIMSKNVNGSESPKQDTNGYYTKLSNEYQGIGSIFSPDQFAKYVIPHIVKEYVMNPKDYCMRFRSPSLGADFCEQDGLIRRIIEKNKLTVAFSCVPRCFHAGFFGYHRMTAGHIRRQPLEHQVQSIYRIAFNVDELRKVAQAENLVYDSLPVNLETNHSECYELRTA